MLQISQTLHRSEKVSVVLNGHFKGYQNIESVVSFRQDDVGAPPSDFQELFQFAFNKIAALAPIFGSSGMPGAIYWTTVPFTSDNLDISLPKSGKGLSVVFNRREMPGMPISEFPSTYTLELSGMWISFGAENGSSDYNLMQYLVNITAPWDGTNYGQPWQVFLVAQPWRQSETGSIPSQAPAPGKRVRVFQVETLPTPVTLFPSAEVYGC
jgi:hypothetical protein